MDARIERHLGLEVPDHPAHNSSVAVGKIIGFVGMGDK